jgi:parallel beta-helix repeat protein
LFVNIFINNSFATGESSDSNEISTVIDPSEGENNKLTDLSKEDYSGIYYLHEDLPEHGQDIGNTHDVGDLLRQQPHGAEERYCAKWVQFDFDEHVFGESTGDESFTIKNIYYHIWWKSANEKADIGVEMHGIYDSHTEYSFHASHKDAVSTVEKNGYWLTTNIQEVSYVEEDIHDMAVKVTSIDAIPSVYSGTNQYSFIIINLDDDEILKTNDEDYDGLTDYDELFTYFTNPNDKDTDNDGLNDQEEVIEGVDGFITDPNNFDMDIDDLIDGNDPNPLLTQYTIINKEWFVNDDEIIKNDGLLVKNDIIVQDGGKLTIEDTVLKMNQDGEQHKIRVDPGGELTIRNSNLITNDPDHWYSKTLQTDHWHNERTIEIYGKASIIDNKIDYGGMIYIRDSNDTILEGNEINHYYYGIFCSYSSPILNDNKIFPFIGNGIFLWHSSPEITNNVIKTYIGTGISCYYSSPIIRDSEISGGSNDFYLSGNSHPIVSNTLFNKSMVHVEDSESSLLIGTFEGNNDKESQSNDQTNDHSNIHLELGIIFFFIISIILACLLIPEKFYNFTQQAKSDFNDNDSKQGGESSKKKSRRSNGGKNRKRNRRRNGRNRRRNSKRNASKRKNRT